MGTLTSWNPLGHSRPVTGLIYLYLWLFSFHVTREVTARSEPDGTQWRTGGEVKGKHASRVGSQKSCTLPQNMVYPALLPLMRTPRLPAVNWTDAPTDLNAVGSQYPSHYLGTWCIQHYYRWCAHLGCPVVDWTDAPTDLNAVGSQYPSHYLGTWCIQHYYRWCAHLGCQQSTELTPLLI